MQKQAFQRWFKNLHAHYPGFQMPDPRTVMDIYFKELGRYSENVLEVSVGGIISSSPQFFPTAGVIRNACESLIDASRAQNKRPRVRHWPHDHGCDVEGKLLELSGPRKFLYNFNAYESAHVLCATDKPPVCPWCGIDVKPFINPMISLLMNDYPKETQGWNPVHKGNVLCAGCERMDYPQQFI